MWVAESAVEFERIPTLESVFRRKTAEFFTCTGLLLAELILIIFGCMQQLLKSQG